MKGEVHFTKIERYILNPLCPVAKAIFRWFFGIKYSGLENVPEGPCIVAANHRSHLDPPVLNSVLPRPLVFLAKEELFKPPLGWFLKHMRAIPVRRRGDFEVLKISLDLLNKGLQIGIFPEGTRAQPGKFLKPKAGVGILAVKSGVPVVPVLIEGTDRSLPRGAKFPRPFGDIRVRIGQPLVFKDSDDSPRGYREVAERIMQRIQELSSSSLRSL